jgi:hypothetical protein
MVLLCVHVTNKNFSGIFPDHFFMVKMTTDKHFSFKITVKLVTNKNEGGFLICVIQLYKFNYDLKDVGILGFTCNFTVLLCSDPEL